MPRFSSLPLGLLDPMYIPIHILKVELILEEDPSGSACKHRAGQCPCLQEGANHGEFGGYNKSMGNKHQKAARWWKSIGIEKVI